MSLCLAGSIAIWPLTQSRRCARTPAEKEPNGGGSGDATDWFTRDTS